MNGNGKDNGGAFRVVSFFFLSFSFPEKKKKNTKTREGKRKTKQQKSLQITKEHEKQEYLVLFFITANG